MLHEIGNNDGDMIRDACGVLGIYAPGKNVAQLAYYGLYALQHRGQESAGIAVSNGWEVNIEKGMGLVSEVFQDDMKLNSLVGHIATAHVRYSTMGSSILLNVQPLLFRYRNGYLAVAHNGQLINGGKLRSQLENEGSIFQTTTDSEIIAHLIARSGKTEIEEAVKEAAQSLSGAYSFVLMTKDKLIALRDPNGVRPFCLGKIDGGFVVASETCALDTIGAEFIRDIKPGEMIVIDSFGIRSEIISHTDKGAFCIFEFIYFARPDSNINFRNVHLVRKELGKRLAKEHQIKADLVTGVPDSSLSAATGVAEQLGLPYEMGFIKNRYVGRTFIEPAQEIRSLGVKLKLNPAKSIIEGKKVVVVEDSIVRGTTSSKIIDMLKHAGAKEVYVLVSSPPIRFPCFYGIDFSSPEELIAYKRTVWDIALWLKADYLGYLSVEGMLESVGLPGELFCTACFTGNYPIKLNGQFHKTLFEKLGDNRGKLVDSQI